MQTRFKLRLYGGVAVAGLLLTGAALADDFVVGSGQTVGQRVLPNVGDTLLIEQGGTSPSQVQMIDSTIIRKLRNAMALQAAM